MADILEETANRKNTIRLTDNPAAYARQRMAEKAAAMNLAGVLQSRIEIVSEALWKFVELCYLADTDGRFANVDYRTYRLLLPAPWGRAGYAKWELRQHEATVLRKILMNRIQHSAQQRAPLFDYGNGIWYLNANSYPEYVRARVYLERKPLTLQEWRENCSCVR